MCFHCGQLRNDFFAIHIKVVLVILRCQHLPRLGLTLKASPAYSLKLIYSLNYICMHTYKVMPGMDLSNLQLTTQIAHLIISELPTVIIYILRLRK